MDTILKSNISQEEGISSVENPKKTAKQRKTLTPEEKLERRINQEFKTCRYIGDINVSDEEYKLLIKHFRQSYVNLRRNPEYQFADRLFAVALVQIGIKHYDVIFVTEETLQIGRILLPAPLLNMNDGFIIQGKKEQDLR